MRYNHDEYEQMVFDLNICRSKKVMVIGAVVTSIISFIIMLVFYKDIYFGLVIAIIAALVTYFFTRKAVLDSAKKANFIKNIKYIDQTINEDKIVEKVVDYQELENIGEYYFDDMICSKDDDKNFYLYLNKNAAVIVSKSKIENINSFKEILIKHNLLK